MFILIKVKYKYTNKFLYFNILKYSRSIEYKPLGASK